MHSAANSRHQHLKPMQIATIIVAASTESIVAHGWSKIGAGRSGFKTINAMSVCSQYQEMDDTQRKEIDDHDKTLLKLVGEYGRLPYVKLKEVFQTCHQHFTRTTVIF